jgi:murein L,D-transpeptidase YafK
VFKQEKKIEVWALKNENFVLLNTYPICAASGVLGRKTKEGDRQVPEGIYKILIFNSKSDYHLSLGINYPNEADIFWADKQFPGNEIYIHGNCVSVGCLAVTNNLIEEIYLMAHEAHEAGQEEIPIHIFPFDMRKFDPNHLSPNYRHHIEFWKELKLIFDFFEQHQKLPHIRVNEYGQYTI